MTTAWSCVVDDTPKIWSAIVPWLATVTHLSRKTNAQVHVHHVCPLRADVAEMCHQLGVQCHQIEAFDKRSPHSNKIMQSLTRYSGVSRIVLTDVDVVFNDDVPIAEIENQVAGKYVDHPNPPIGVLQKIFSAANLPHPRIENALRFNSALDRIDFETFPANYNGGVYILDAAIVNTLGNAWAYWAKWLLKNIELLERWTIQVDQVSFCLAVNALNLNSGTLDYSWNFPYHLSNPDNCPAPKILHHHGLLDCNLNIKDSDNTTLRREILKINQVITKFRKSKQALGPH